MKKEKKKAYFVNEHGKIFAAINGRYGVYATDRGVNRSEKFMLNYGYNITYLTDAEAAAKSAKYNDYINALRERERNERLQHAADCVKICLESEPLNIGGGNHLFGHITHIVGGAQEAYHGCGEGLAYVKNGQIIAFNYGFERPNNAPIYYEVSGCIVYCCRLAVGIIDDTPSFVKWSAGKAEQIPEQIRMRKADNKYFAALSERLGMTA